MITGTEEWFNKLEWAEKFVTEQLDGKIYWLIVVEKEGRWGKDTFIIREKVKPLFLYEGEYLNKTYKDGEVIND